ncbi:hypothetical protein LCGC14_1804120 [marine sediment metagenome]|uniref:Uncharacterized protein n=1 Tax=marine sediment metagenome TaxID=412755 RepID=A0A0F9JND7_9ZZZZ
MAKKAKKAKREAEQLRQQQVAIEAREKQSKKSTKAAKKQAKRHQREEQAAITARLYQAAEELVEQNKQLVGAIEMSIAASSKKGRKKGRKQTAKNRGGARAFANVYESGEHETGQDKPRRMKSTGPAGEALEALDFQVVDKPISKAKMEMLAFNEEIIKVVVHDSANDNDEPIPSFTNDGRAQNFIRGQTLPVKRKFVEQLAGCKKTIYTHIKVQDGQGNDTYDYIPHTTLAFPFMVVEDPNPRGQAWLAAIQQRG